MSSSGTDGAAAVGWSIDSDYLVGVSFRSNDSGASKADTGLALTIRVVAGGVPGVVSSSDSSGSRLGVWRRG